MSQFVCQVYDPRFVPAMRCAVAPLSLRQGEVSLIQNLRTDAQSLIARVADATINASPPAGAKTSGGAFFPMGSFQGFLNGTAFWLSAWQMAAGGVAIFSQDLTTGAYTEITDVGNATPTTWGGTTTGATRFPTQSAYVSFCPQPTPRRVAAGVSLQTLDILVVQNGEDYPMVYNPGAGLTHAANLMWHQPILVPAQANTFHTLVSASAFWQVKGNTKTYFASAGPPRINQANFSLADTVATYGVTDATLRVILMTLGTLANSGDIATVRFPLSGVSNQESFRGNWMNLIFEGSTADLQFIFNDTKIEINQDNVAYNVIVSPWQTIFDPTSADPSLSTLPPFVQIDASTATPRWQLGFTLQNIVTLANRTAYHIRFTRTSAIRPAANRTVLILAGWSTGNGGGFPYGTEWTAAYSDHFAHAESAPFVMTRTDVDLLSNIGGPKGPDANPNSAIVLARDPTVFYDYRMKVKASDSNTAINGGLQGQPNCIDFYFRNPTTETTPFYFSSWVMWSFSGGGFTWNSNAQSGAGGTETLRSEQIQNFSTTPDGFGFSAFGANDYGNRDPGLPPPSDFNQNMPKAAVIAGAGGRLFCGNNKYTTGYTRGEVVFSDLGFFGRFRSVQDNSDPNSGGRFVYAGETIKAIRTAAAAAEGAVQIYVWSDRTFNAQGSPGGYSFIGSSFVGLSLEQRYRISADGTLEPGSIIEHNGEFAWAAIDGHFKYFAGGSPINISVGHVTNPQGVSGGGVLDVIADIPASRRGRISGIFSRNRFIWFMTPAGATVNSRGLIWDNDRRLWESIDTIANGEFAVAAYDSAMAGAGQRILLHGTDGKTYGFEEGTGAVAIRLTDRGRLASEVLGAAWKRGTGFTVDEVELMCERDAGKAITVDYYRNMGASAVQFTLSLDAQATDEWILESDSNSGFQVAGWSAYFDVNGSITGGKKINSLCVYAEYTGADLRGQG